MDQRDRSPQGQHLCSSLARTRRRSSREQRGREAGCCHSEVSFKGSGGRHGFAQTSLARQPGRRKRRVLRGFRCSSAAFDKEPWLSSSRCQRQRSQCQKGKRGQETQEEQGGRPLYHPCDLDGEGARTGPEPDRLAASHDDEFDHAEQAGVAEEQARHLRPQQLFHSQPWWFQLRERKRQRQLLRKGHESGCDFAPPPQQDQEEASQHLQSIRKGDHHRARNSPRTTVDTPTVVGQAALGQVPRHLQMCDPRRHRLRVPQEWPARGGSSSVSPKHEVEDPKCSPARRLELSLAPHRDLRSSLQEGMGRNPGRDGHCERVCECSCKAEEEGQRGQRFRPPGGCGRGPSFQVIADFQKFLHDQLRGCQDPLMSGCSTNSKFVSYYAWLECAQSALSNVVDSSSSPIFPCSLPYPEVFYSEGAVSDDLDGSVWARRYLNAFVAWCNYVELGCPDCREGVCEPQATYQSETFARRFADRWLGEVEEFGSLELLQGNLELRGSRRAVEEAFDSVACTAAGYFGEASSNLSGALEVKAERVAIPDTAGTVDPAGILPAEQKAVFENLESVRRPEHLWDKVVPSCHRVDPGEEVGLMRKLLQHKMVVLIQEDSLPKDSKGRFLTSGLFCVPKNETEDRLILDRRPQNATMNRLPWAELPSGACFSRLLLQPHEYLRGSGDDLRNFYYSLKLPSNWIKYNAVGRRVDPRLVREFGYDPNYQYRACFRVLGMGDRNACDIAQATHEALLEKVGLLTSSTKLVFGKPLPRGPILEGVYLDDLLVVQKCSMTEPIPQDGTFVPPPPTASDQDQRRVQQAEQAYAEVGLPRAVHKAFRGQTDFKAWGAEIQGVKGTAGAPKHFRQQVWVLLCRVVKLEHCTKNILQKILGYVCFIFQYRRELYSLQHHIYKFLQKMPSKGWRFLPGFIVDELRSMGLRLAFAFWDMRHKISPSLLCTDATPTSGGAARTEVSDELATELWHCGELRGAAVRLDESELHRMLDEWDAPKEPSVWASTVGKTLNWRVTSSYSFRQTSHINLQEARAVKNEVKKLSREENSWGKIQVSLNDSRVVCGAFTKGRSSSFKLNGVMRSMLPYLIFANLVFVFIWIETGANPADHPSRFQPIPPPLPCPLWLKKFGVFGRANIGWELFAGTARLTKAHRQFGIRMLDPVDILFGSDVLSADIERTILLRLVLWLWMAPPCGSFSPLRNLDRGGPLRPKGNPAGDEDKWEVARGNQLWRRALELAHICLSLGIYFFIEHPRGSKAWQLPETQRLREQPGVYMAEVHWCMFEDEERVGNPNKKPTRVLTSAPWFKNVVRVCDQSHVHGPPLRGRRARLAGAYPWGFCRALAVACSEWQGWWGCEMQVCLRIIAVIVVKLVCGSWILSQGWANVFIQNYLLRSLTSGWS